MGSSSPTQTQRRAVDAGELVEDIERAHQLETRGIQVRVDDRARVLLLTGDPGAEQGPAAGPLLIGHRRVIVAVGALDDPGHLVAPGQAERLDDPAQVEPSPCGLQHHRPGVTGVARRVDHRDEAAKGVSVDDRPNDPEGVAERTDVVGAHLEPPGRRVAPLGPPMSAQIQVDHLGRLREPSEFGLEVGVVETPGTAMQQHDGGPLAHHGAVGHERRAVDVKPQACPAHLDVHARLL